LFTHQVSTQGQFPARGLPYFLSKLEILLAAIKPQETWLFLGVLFYLILRYWTPCQKIKVSIIVGNFLLISMFLWGLEWGTALFTNPKGEVNLSAAMGRGSLIDITLAAALGRLGMQIWGIRLIWLLLLITTAVIVFYSRYSPLRSITPFLLSASMLLAPYVSGNSFLTIVAMAIIPMLQHDKAWGIPLYVLTEIPFFATTTWLINYQSYYWTLLLLVVWGLTGWFILKDRTANLACSRPAFGGRNAARNWQVK